MDFQSVNPLNFQLNLLSGNLLPMTGDDTPYSILWRIYSGVTWLLHIIAIILLFRGCTLVSKETAISGGMLYIVVFAELLFMVTRLFAYNDELNQIIRNLNDILRSADETMKNVVTTTLRPVRLPLMVYFITFAMTELGYDWLSFQLLFKKDVFSYEDYPYPFAFFNQPLSSLTFFLGTLLIFINLMYMSMKKVSTDVYLVHVVLMMTAQYRYNALKLSAIFQNRNENVEYKSRKMDSYNRTKTELRALCQHHNLLLHISLLLKKVLSLMFVVLHLNAVLRFCFIGISTVSIASGEYWEILMYIVYMLGATVQLYILCSCVQQLSDASTEVTDKAFHQEWYLSEPSIKSTFMLMVMANNLECKLAVVDNFNLTLPSFMKILNQAYSVALLFLRMN